MKLSQIIKNYKDTIIGGKGDNTDINTLPKKELAVGILVEKEHTSNIEQACEIAGDHLTENPNYYSKLIASGMVDEKPALDLAKSFGWIIKKESKLESIIGRIVREKLKCQKQ